MTGNPSSTPGEGATGAQEAVLVDAKNVEVVTEDAPLMGGGAQVAPLPEPDFWKGIHMGHVTIVEDQRERFNIEGGDLSQVLMVKLAPGGKFRFFLFLFTKSSLRLYVFSR